MSIRVRYLLDICSEIKAYCELNSLVKDCKHVTQILYVCEPTSEYAKLMHGNERYWGYTETEANNKQGLLSLKYDGANIIVIWIQQVDATPEAMLKDTYQVVKNSSKTLSFVAVSEGDLTISKQQGRFGSLIATDASGKAAGGALIGSMVCKNTNTALSLTVTSGNATTLQVRFDRLIKGLECPA